MQKNPQKQNKTKISRKTEGRLLCNINVMKSSVNEAEIVTELLLGTSFTITGL